MKRSVGSRTSAAPAASVSSAVSTVAGREAHGGDRRAPGPVGGPVTIAGDLLAVIRERARAFHPHHKFAHGWDHVERVVALADHLALAERADRAIVAAAALLHDIGRDEEDRSEGRICHAARGAALAQAMLSELQLPAAAVAAVVHAVGAHRYRGSRRPETLEAKVVHDADKLDAIGAVGLGRAFQFAGAIGARLHNPEVPDLERTETYSLEDTAWREFQVKLRFLAGRMLTDSGRQLAEGRHRFMVDFFTRLGRECEGEL